MSRPLVCRRHPSYVGHEKPRARTCRACYAIRKQFIADQTKHQAEAWWTAAACIVNADRAHTAEELAEAEALGGMALDLFQRRLLMMETILRRVLFRRRVALMDRMDRELAAGRRRSSRYWSTARQARRSGRPIRVDWDGAKAALDAVRRSSRHRSGRASRAL